MFDHNPNRADRIARARLARMILFGTVKSVAPVKATVRIALGPEPDAPVLGPYPWITTAAGPHITNWRPPEIGEQAVVLCPGGDPEQGVALVGIYSDRVPPPSTDLNVCMQTFGDGAEIAYDRKAHKLTATLPDGGSAEITAPGGLKVTGPLTVTGDMDVTGNVDASGDLTAGGDVSDGKTLAAFRTIYNQHTHSPANVPPNSPVPKA